MNKKNILFLLFIIGASSVMFAQNEIATEKSESLKAYEEANLKQKFEMNKNYAIKEGLPILSGYQTIVEDKFAGVKNFGNLVTKTNFTEKQDILKLTGNNSDF